MRHVILLGHGSPDARAGTAAGELAQRVEEQLGMPVSCAFLDNGIPLIEVCADVESQGATSAVIVPLFLTAAFHVKVDVPKAVEEARSTAGIPLLLTAYLGVDDAIVSAVDAQLPQGPVVLAVAGTRDVDAHAELDLLAVKLSERRGAPVAVGHAAMGPTSVIEALELVESGGASASVAALVLFPGVLPDRITADAGARHVSAPLSLLPETVQAIVGRVRDIAAS